jgi:hypothetical protein
MSTLHSVRLASDGSLGVSVGDSPLMRSAPEPRSSLGTWGQAAGSVLASTATTLTGVGSGLFSGGTDITSLLNKQIEIQQVMQVVSMASNVERSKHETEMAPIRNMRVG